MGMRAVRQPRGGRAEQPGCACSWQRMTVLLQQAAAQQAAAQQTAANQAGATEDKGRASTGGSCEPRPQAPMPWPHEATQGPAGATAGAVGKGEGEEGRGVRLTSLPL